MWSARFARGRFFCAWTRTATHGRSKTLLAILDAGAYGMVLTSNYNSRLRPPEVLVDGKTVKLIRRRERMDDLLRTETQVR